MPTDDYCEGCPLFIPGKECHDCDFIPPEDEIPFEDVGDDFDLDELIDDYPLPLYDPEDLFGDEEEEEK